MKTIFHCDTLHVFAKSKLRTFFTLLLVTLFLSFAESKGQSPVNPFSKQTIADTSVINNDSLSVEEKLVALALNSPQYRASENQNKINEYQLKAAKNQWVNLLTLSANFNDQNFFAQNQANNVVFPRYFFGLNVPLGTILSRTTVKSAKQQVEISKYNQEQLARNIRAEILSKYQRYKNYAELILIQNQITDDEEAAYLQSKEKFRNGLITIDVFNVAQKLYNLELSNKLNLKLEQDLIKIDIERMIGTSLDSVIK